MAKRTKLAKATQNDFSYSLPAIRAIQAGQEYFTTVIPFGVLAKLLNSERMGTSTAPIDRDRPKAIAQYIRRNQKRYVLPALTLTVSGSYRFTPISDLSSAINVGSLSLPVDAVFKIVDGRFRISGIADLIATNPELADETISIILFPESKSADRPFGDIKLNQRKSGRSERIVSDPSDEIAIITRDLIANVSAFADSIEMVKTTISNRSHNLFTFSALYQANEILLADQANESVSKRTKLAITFWRAIQEAIPDWTSDKPRVDLRKQTVHAHSVTLCAIAMAGKSLITRFSKTWVGKLGKLRNIDWSRENSQQWEGKAMLGGRMTKSAASIDLTAKVLFKHINDLL